MSADVIVRRLGVAKCTSPGRAPLPAGGDVAGVDAAGALAVEVAPPDATQPLLARCRACRRPVVYAVLAPGSWCSVTCRHCRVIVRVAVPPR